MKAVVLQSHGSPDRIAWSDWPDAAKPSAGEVRARMRAVALNRLDLFVLAGMENVRVPLPMVVGSDGAGVVDAVGPGVEGLAPGDRVLVQPGLYCGVCESCRAGAQNLCPTFRIIGEHVPGVFAELATLPARNFFKIPEGMDFARAAAFPLSYQTAWRMIVTRAAVRPGETVLVHGIGGGVAWACLEIARLSGARVVVTSGSEEKLARAREAGAEAGWNYRTEDVARRVAAHTGKRGCDVVVDSVGEATWLASLRCAARGGRIVTCGATSGPNPEEEIRLIFWKQLSILGSTMANDAEFRAMLSVVASGRLSPRVDTVIPIARAAEAYRRMLEGEQLGKIVLELPPP